MNRIHLDFEDFCELNLKDVGAHKRFAHPSYEPLCAGWAINDQPVQLSVLPGRFPQPLIDSIEAGYLIYAWNAAYEKGVIDKWYSQFGLSKPPSMKQYRCTMSIACSMGFPASLHQAGIAMSAGFTKTSNAAMLKLCKPRKPTKKDPSVRWTMENAAQSYQDMYKYCAMDVESERAIYNVLPIKELPELEETYYRHTLIRNDRGVPIDIDSVHNITRMVEGYRVRENNRLFNFTHQSVDSATKRDKLLNYINETFSLTLPDLTKGTVADTIDDPDTIGIVKAILRIRQQLSKSSTAKFPKMQAQIMLDGTIKGNEQYFGAGTGRLAGRGFQLHNLPAAKEKYPEPVLNAFNNWSLEDFVAKYTDVFTMASKMVRPSLCAPKGERILDADYNSIENRLIHWYAGDQKTLDDFAAGIDQYKTYAASYFGKTYGEVTKEERTFSKPNILGLQFGGGEGALKGMAKNYGIELDQETARNIKLFYRESKYPLVVDFWKACKEAADLAVQYPNRIAETHKLQFVRWKDMLCVKLASGRWLYYQNVKWEEVINYWHKTIAGPPLGIVAFQKLPYEEQLNYRMSKQWCTTFWSVDSETKCWMKKTLTIPTLINNIIQATARDLLCHGALKAELAGYYVIGTIHDQIISLIPAGVDWLPHYCQTICDLPEWAAGLPLAAEGYIDIRFHKD